MPVAFAGELRLQYLRLTLFLALLGIFFTFSACSQKGKDVEDKMILIPAGPFWMGCNTAIDNQCMQEELPFHEVELPDYWIDLHEVTVGEYLQCVEAQKCGLPQKTEDCNHTHQGRDRHPMNCVSNEQARDYCAFVGKALPTEEQWEKAARGTDGRLYPWGNTFDPKRVTYRKKGERVGTVPVGSNPSNASPYGVLDMSGNVWEWTSTVYVRTTTPRTVDNTLKPYTFEMQSWVFKGGSWDCDQTWPLRISGRTWSKPIRNTPILGFRCVKPAAEN